jgi:cysteinyl-tRNA synthetase
MVRTTLGDTIDIHSGGQDLIFPHHENELAQSEARTDEPFVRYWVHIGLVTTAGEKMSHSLLNFRTVQDVLAEYEPMALRLYLLQTHYRAPLAFKEEALAAAARGLTRLRGALEPVGEGAEPSADWPVLGEARARFLAAMDDDLNTSAALAGLFDLVAELNARRAAARQGDRSAASDLGAGQAALQELTGVLGLELTAAAAPRGSVAAQPFVELLLEVRRELREARQWALADRIRDGLKERGVTVEDRADGSTWRFE